MDPQPFYLSPLAYPYLVNKLEFTQINAKLDRLDSLNQAAANIANTHRENKAIVVQGTPGSGRTTFAINLAVHFAPSTNTCIHYFPQSCLQAKSFQASLIESPAVPISCLWNQQHASLASRASHIVIVDDVVDLKHFSEIKSIIHKLDARTHQRERVHPVFYVFIVDHAESRPLSSRMQKLLRYIKLAQPTAEQCLKLLEDTPVWPKYSFSNLTTLFAAVRTFQHGSGRRHFPYVTDQVSAEHEKDALFELLKQVFVERQRVSWKDQQRLLQSTDCRNVANHYLENLPGALDVQPDLSLRQKHRVYLETLRLSTSHDFTEAALQRPDRNWTGHADATQRELTQYLRLGAMANVAARSLQPTTTRGALHVQEARDLEFTRLNTKFSMQQSEKWFMTLVSLRFQLYDLPLCVSSCMQKHLANQKAPIDSESFDVWKKYFDHHPFLKDQATVLSVNDYRHLFRYLHMQIGALTVGSSRMQLSEEVWVDRTFALLGENSSIKRHRRKRGSAELVNSSDVSSVHAPPI